MADSYLQGLVVARCKELNDDAKAGEFFGVAPSLIRQWVSGSKTPSLASVEKVFVPQPTAFANAEWEGKNLFIACPAYKSVHPATLFTLVALWDRAKMGFRVRFNDAFIVHARNMLAMDFLASGMPECYTFDDDMVWPAGQAAWYNETTGLNLPEKFAGLHSINQLRSRNKTLVGGLYFGRNRFGRAMYHEAMQKTPEGERENARAHSAPFDECKETQWVATGGLFFKREVLLDIQKTFPHLAPQHLDEPWHFFSNTADAVMKGFADMQAMTKEVQTELFGGNAEKANALLGDLVKRMNEASEEVIKNNRLQQGEDQLFGRRALAAGHQSHVDLALVGAHIGFNAWGPGNTNG
jgi:hypothetical protein